MAATAVSASQFTMQTMPDMLSAQQGQAAQNMLNLNAWDSFDGKKPAAAIPVYNPAFMVNSSVPPPTVPPSAASAKIVQATGVPAATTVPSTITQATQQDVQNAGGPLDSSQTIPDTAGSVPKNFLAPSNTTAPLQEQVDNARMQKEVMQQSVAGLQGQVSEAAAALEKAKADEQSLWTQAKAASSQRGEAEVSNAVTTATWNTVIANLDDSLSDAQVQAKNEKDDLKAMQALADEAEREQTKQAKLVTQMAAEQERDEAYKAGAEAQRAADEPMMKAMTAALEKVTAAANAGAEAEATLTKMSLKAGKSAGETVKTYPAQSEVAKVVAQGLSSVALGGQDLKAQEELAAAVGIDYDTPSLSYK